MSSTIACNIGTKKFIKNYEFEPIRENMKLTSIIIPVFNQLEYTKLCVESIRKFTPLNSYEIIIVDNNSTDNTKKWLEKQKDVKAIYNDENKGCTIACNQGIKEANGENILLLNNDVIVTPNWLNNLYKALYSSENIGAVGAISNNVSNFQQAEVEYNDIQEMLKIASMNNVSNRIQWDYKEKLVGYVFMVKKSVLDKTGLLDEYFSPGNYDDFDISYRILISGYKLLLCKDVFVHHFGGVTQNAQMSEFTKSINENRIKFEEKWGLKVNDIGAIKYDVINLIKEDKNKIINVLEVGCSTGANLQEIKGRYKNSKLYGVEISEGASKIASTIGEIITGDIEEVELPYEKEYFDYIILPNILDKLRNPWDTLKKITKYIKKNGYVLATISNAMNHYYLKNLILGSFKYEESGAINKDTLRLFTINDIQELFNNEGYTIETATGQALQPSKEDEKFIDYLMTISNKDYKQQYMIYEYLIKATLNGNSNNRGEK
ncbi:MAG: glycosyltransferase [Clostridium sp.]